MCDDADSHGLLPLNQCDIVCPDSVLLIVGDIYDVNEISVSLPPHHRLMPDAHIAGVELKIGAEWLGHYF